ncbi:huntingtin-interacting protein 1 [Suricata suricatta]|uniref:huntingtin-interacting protein 1 n=1 Tax=Suricata suricatta TaxID=37032 RepID=UPI0011558E05|nr:huntingtin-interacting protein 1 [Suricata suricatta]
MDRMASSMKQVPNPLPKVLSRRGVGAGIEAAERESFERTQTVSINKAINTQEVAVKEKHARTCILGTHHEKGAQTFWSVVNRLPLSSNAVLCWKFCHVFHKLLRDGHPNVLKDSLRYKNELSDMSRMWGHLSEGYGRLCSTYLRLLRTKMEYHTKNPRFPGNLQMSDRQLDEAGESDVNNFFQLTVEMFDYLECELNLFQTVFNSLDMSRSVSVTTAGQCRLAPLIQVILDCSHLYDYTVKLLFKLHSCLPADTLQGHRDRFMEQFTKLKDLFYRSSNLQYFKRLIQIPQLPENPPNFLRASALSEHISPVVVIPAEASSPDSEPVLEKDDLVDMDASQQNLFDNKFDDIFGSSFSSDPFNFNSQNGVNKEEKDHLIAQLYRDISELKARLENMKTESQRAVLQLKGRVSELEAELAEQQHLRQQAVDDSEFLRTELDELKKKREDTEKAQRSLTEIERRAQANEQRYSKLKEKYSELVQNHADLLRKNAEVTKQVSVARQAQADLEREKKELEDSFQRLSDQAQRKTQEQTEVLDSLKQELATSKQELQIVQGSLETSAQSEAKWAAQLEELEKERSGLVRAVARGEEEESALREQLEHAQRELSSTQESMCQLAKGQRKTLLVETRKAAEQVIQEALRQLEEPPLISCAGSADHLLSKVKSVSSCIEQLEQSWSQYLACPEEISELLRSVTLLAHLTSDTMAHVSTTCLRAPPEPADSLTEACKQFGKETLTYLAFLGEDGTLENDSTAMKSCLSKISAIGEELLPRGLDIKQEELGDLVDKEMAATSAAIETATARIEEMLSKSRAGDTGVKLEVNERILGSCTSLMQAIQVLIVASKDLQREIVESGRGTASPKEFYAKNSRWTEGLISASKAVGWGATVMVDAADLVVQGRGKFEELMVCSHEIAASTAQLVAASKVKADKDSPNLAQLQQASRGVNQATATVVASTISGKSQIQETDNMDFSSMTLTQIKRQEMDSQVRVLELENELQKERQKLGELRKKHYELAGVAEGWEEVTRDAHGARRDHAAAACSRRAGYGDRGRVLLTAALEYDVASRATASWAGRLLGPWMGHRLEVCSRSPPGRGGSHGQPGQRRRRRHQVQHEAEQRQAEKRRPGHTTATPAPTPAVPGARYRPPPLASASRRSRRRHRGSAPRRRLKYPSVHRAACRVIARRLRHCARDSDARPPRATPLLPGNVLDPAQLRKGGLPETRCSAFRCFRASPATHPYRDEPVEESR